MGSNPVTPTMTEQKLSLFLCRNLRISRIRDSNPLGEAEQNCCRDGKAKRQPSNPVTPTKKEDYRYGDLLFLLQRQISAISCLSWTNSEGPGIEYDCCRWQMKGVRNGAAVKILRCEKRAKNIGHRKKKFFLCVF